MKKSKRTISEPAAEAGALPANELSDELRNDPNSEEIAALAHRLWEQQGHPEGRALEHWLEAEAQIRMQRDANTMAGST